MSSVTAPLVAGNGRFPSDVQQMLSSAGRLVERCSSRLTEESTEDRFASIEVPVPAGWQPIGWKSVPPLTVSMLSKHVAMSLAIHWNHRRMLCGMGDHDWAVVVPYGSHSRGVMLVDVGDWRPLNSIDLPPRATEVMTHCGIRRIVKETNRRRLSEGTAIATWTVIIAEPYVVNCGC